MVFVTTVGLELGLLLLCYWEGLRCDLWCLVLRWDWNWSYCCCIIIRVWDMTCFLVLRWDCNWIYCYFVIGNV